MLNYSEQNCGFDNIWLLNGYKQDVATMFGLGLEIRAFDNLHQIIIETVTNTDVHLSATAISSIRLHMEWSREFVAQDLFYKSAKTIEAIEAGKIVMSKQKQKLFKTVVNDGTLVNQKLAKAPHKFVFVYSETRNCWSLLLPSYTPTYSTTALHIAHKAGELDVSKLHVVRHKKLDMLGCMYRLDHTVDHTWCIVWTRKTGAAYQYMSDSDADLNRNIGRYELVSHVAHDEIAVITGVQQIAQRIFGNATVKQVSSTKDFELMAFLPVLRYVNYTAFIGMLTRLSTEVNADLEVLNAKAREISSYVC